jgi:hypothetical protein
MKPGQVFIAPAGTSPLEAGWKPLGHTSRDGLIVDGTITADRITSGSIAANYHCFPQRFMLGTTTQELPLPLPSETFTDTNGRGLTVSTSYGKTNLSTSSYLGATISPKDTPELALSILAHDDYKNRTRHLSSTDTIAVGYDELEGRVYVPKDEKQALRNLNFAIANLAAYERYQNVVKPAQAAEAKKKAEAEAKRQADLAAAKKRVEEGKLERSALRLYNATKGTGYSMWPTFMGQATRDKWISLAKAAEQINSTVTMGTVNASSLFGNGGYNSAIFPSSFASGLNADIRKAYGL